jgi:hypothetical protein
MGLKFKKIINLLKIAKFRKLCIKKKPNEFFFGSLVALQQFGISIEMP